MKIIKRVSVLSILIVISFLFVGCDKKDAGMSELKTYSNGNYTLEYPSNWVEPELVINKDRTDSVVFSEGDNQFSFKINEMPMDKNYFEESIREKEKEEEDFNVEDYIIGGNKGIKSKSNLKRMMT